MPDLDQQLRAYFDVLAEEVENNVISRGGRSDIALLDHHDGPIAPHKLSRPEQTPADDLVVDYLHQQPDGSEAPPQRNGWFGVVVGVAATILVVVGVVVVADGNSGNVVTDPASTPSVTDPLPPAGESETGPPPSVTDSLGYRWSRVPHDEAVFGGASTRSVKVPVSMNGVTVGGPGLVAVGSEWPPQHAAVWTSPDGFSWSRVPHDEAVFGGDRYEAGMSSLTAGGPGLVAVGRADDADAADDSNAAVWISVDGLTWSRVPHDEAVFGGPGEQGMSDVVVGGPGLVAVGSDGDFYAGTLVAAVWTSVDGLSWSRVPHDEAVFGGARNQTMSSVTVGGPGLVAVGSDGDPHGPGWDDDPAEIAAAAVWTSVDGLTWSRVPHDEAVFGGVARQWMTSVTAGGPGVVAVGFGLGDEVAPGGGMVWTSPDGVTWSRVPDDEAVLAGADMKSVTATSRGLVVVGDLDLLTSPDGFSWSRAPYDEAVFGERGGDYAFRNNMLSVIAAGPGVVAVGMMPTAAAVWVGVADN